MKPLREGWRIEIVLGMVLLGLPGLVWAESMGEGDRVSYWEDVRPIFQAKCQGCHQPAKAKGEYVMTDVAKLIAGGDTGEAVVAHAAAKSFLIEMVTPVDGEVEMPPKGEPLTDEELGLVTRWIEEGALDDTPANALQKYDQDHPPVYAVPPVVTAMDYSPDGKWLAVAGFHEVLLHHADGSGLAGRLVGLSERIESVAFSPDGTRLAVTGGLPGRMGEVQIWDVAKRELDVSVPVTFDTVYGASWSPDGALVAFGCADNSVRAIDARSGSQVLFMGGHNDWVLDTVFTVEGEGLVSVGRDMSTKLTEVETERFVDNLSSITPGALKGGIAAVARHPEKDEVLVGGADGVPQIYRTKRETARKIGDNANLIRKFPAMKGRIWDVAYSPDGETIACVSSLNGTGQVNLYAAKFDSAIPEEVKKVFEKAAKQTVEADEQLKEDFWTKGVKLLASIEVPETPIFSVAFSPDGKTVAASGSDGEIRFIDVETKKVALRMTPVEVGEDEGLVAGAVEGKVNHVRGKRGEGEDVLLEAEAIREIQITSGPIALRGKHEYQQMLVTAVLKSGGTADVTRDVEVSGGEALLRVDERGLVQPRKAGEGRLVVRLGMHEAAVPVKVSGLANVRELDWVRDVNPVITKLGCNAGTCHGAKDGRNGFKLSLRGYDPIFDVRAFSDDHSARRINLASPDDSLMLLKATGGAPHEGQQVTQAGSEYYRVIRDWIAKGAKLGTGGARVGSIEVYPKNPVIDAIGGRQQMRVVATYTDGVKRDVTREAFMESGNIEVATHDDFGLLTTLRRGEAPVLARFEGAYAATTLTVMGDRSGFEWAEPAANNEIDRLVAAKWERMKILPSGLCTDEEFVRRVYLDLTGLPPTAEAVLAFLEDERGSRVKRDALIDELIGAPEFVDYWSNKWADMLMVNSKFLGPEGAEGFRGWIREEVAENRPYDEFVRRILTASGSNKENPASSYYKILRTPEDLMENTTHLFLATRFNCNKCHDHPFERWTQDQYYETAAYFAQVSLKADAKGSGNRKIGGTAVEGAKPLFEVALDLDVGEMMHDRTGEVAPPQFPYQAKHEVAEGASRRERLAAWMTSADNQYFAMSYANRIWGYLLGTGVIEPLDDIRAGNPPSNPELLAYLTEEFIGSGFDVRELMRTICKSRTYQLSIGTNRWNEDDEINFSHAKARRLPAEVLFDSVYAVTGSTPAIPGAKPGMRAVELPDAALDLKSGFLANLGRPVRESSCECERANDVQLGAVMALLSGPAVADAIGDEKNAIARLVKQTPHDRELVEKIFLRVLNRKATEAEVTATLGNWSDIEGDHERLVELLAAREAAWVPVKAERDAKRFAAIEKATADIEEYQPEHDAERKRLEGERVAREKKATAALAAYEKDKLGKSLATWEGELAMKRLWTTWTPAAPSKATVSKGYDLEVLEDGSVLAKGPNTANADFALVVPTEMTSVTGFMIEVTPHEALPGFGPGINQNRNMVVTEVNAKWRPRGGEKEAKAKGVELSGAKATFNQKGFDVKNAINGKLDRNDKGWALAGSGFNGPERAMFQFKEPIVSEKGVVLDLGVICRYSNGDYPVGHFRVYLTGSTKPLEEGLPEAVAGALKVAPGERSEEDQAVLDAYFRMEDAERVAKEVALWKEKRALPLDAKMEGLKAALARAEQPIQEDAKLLQLRKDVDMSVQQSVNRRLTAAQDLTWALINNPAFLFNR
ncbi:MAG: DUF1549 domain-containing protein [Verrucomicrobiota bacterium]